MDTNDYNQKLRTLKDKLIEYNLESSLLKTQYSTIGKELDKVDIVINAWDELQYEVSIQKKYKMIQKKYRVSTEDEFELLASILDKKCKGFYEDYVKKTNQFNESVTTFNNFKNNPK